MKKTSLLAACGLLIAGTAFGGDTIWSVEYNGGLNTVGTFDADNPAVINNIGNMGITAFVNNLEFDGSGNLYTSDGFTLFSVNKGTGVATRIGSHGGVGSSGMTDMAWNPSNNTMYGISTSCAVSSSLHTIDLGTGAAATVCASLLPGACDVGLTYADGQFYGHDLVSDVIYTIDGSCTTATHIVLPFDSNFGQGLCSNVGSGTSYHVAFNNSVFAAELYDFDSAGNYNFRGTFSVLQIAGADVEEGAGDCLTLQTNTFVAGTAAVWKVSGATPGEQVAIVWGTVPGTTGINGFAGYCATFGIKGVNQNKLICRKNADGAGTVSCQKQIPPGAGGLRVLSQAAERNTCPDECVSNLDDQIVQ